jgi:hypothetical protein
VFRHLTDAELARLDVGDVAGVDRSLGLPIAVGLAVA